MQLSRTYLYFLLVLCAGALACNGFQPGTETSSPRPDPPAVTLHGAVVTDDLDALRAHIAAGSNLDVREPTWRSTPLITAAALGKTEAARLLVEAGANLDLQNSHGSTALHDASFADEATAILLIEEGADLNLRNRFGSTPLHIAAFLCHVDVVKALLEAGADRNIRNNQGKTPLEMLELPFEDARPAYDAIAAAIRSFGVELDYELIRQTRPAVAVLLRQQ